MKKLLEKRNALLDEMDALIKKADTETRAFDEAEQSRLDEIRFEIENLDKTLNAMESAEKLEKREQNHNETSDSAEKLEIRAFETYVRNVLEKREGEQNLDMGNNGAIIPTTIANRIITAVRDLCPIFAKSTIFNLGGNLKIPKWTVANGSHDITVGYHDEFTELTADTGKFISVDLSGFLVGSLTLIGKSIINNSAFDVTSFIISEMSKKIAEFIERELLIGDGIDAATGAASTANTFTAAAASAVTGDELIDLQSKIKQVYQTNACWIMNPATFTALKKIKYTTGEYVLQRDMTQTFPYMILGKPVYLSDNMPLMGAGKKSILYGDFSGLAVKMSEKVQIQVLREKYATQHAIGVVAWFEFDSKVMDENRIAALVQGA